MMSKTQLPPPPVDPKSLNPLEEAREKLAEKKRRAAARQAGQPVDHRAPWHFYIPNMIYRGIAWKAWRTRYQNFNWAVIWDVLLECNLHCIYCLRVEESHHADGTPYTLADPEKVLKEVIKLRPRFLLVTGGEPTLLPRLADHLRRIKTEADNPFVTLNTHMVRPMEVYDEILPMLDGLHVSIDGLREGNRQNRGVEGRKLLERLEVLWKKTRALNRPFLVTVFSVVTLNNYQEIAELIERIRGISTEIGIVLTAMQPFDHPLSITAHPGVLGPFLGQMRELQGKYPHVYVDIPILEESGKPEKPPVEVKSKPYIHCVRQYFRTEFTPFGENLVCKPNRFVHLFNRQAAEARRKGDTRMMWKIVWRAATSLLLPKHSTRCYFPCKCELSTEQILSARDPNDPILDFPLYRGRMTTEDVRKAAEFVRRFNPRFREEMLRNFKRDDSS